MSNFDLVDFDNSLAGSPDCSDQYWNVFCDRDGFSVGRIHNQNGYKQFLYYITGINEKFENYTIGNPFARITKWEMLCDMFCFSYGHNLNTDYPKEYPCLLQVWKHFEGSMLHMNYFDINTTTLTQIKSI